jgi:hypothetical protein
MLTQETSMATHSQSLKNRRRRQKHLKTLQREAKLEKKQDAANTKAPAPAR